LKSWVSENKKSTRKPRPRARAEIMKKGSWFYEPSSIYETSKIAFRVKEELFHKSSKFQDIRIVDSFLFKKVLLIDGLVQTTEADEFIYHEMMAHIPLLSHPSPKKVLIIGGGDGGVLREALNHKEINLTMVEIDGAVIEACRKFLPEINRKAFEDKRAEIVIDDGFKYIKEHKNSFDIIIVDSCDPHGPAQRLFDKNFYKSVYDSLKKDGIAVYQSGFAFIQKNTLENIITSNKKFFPFVDLYLVSIPSYGGGFYAFTLASKKINPAKIDLKKIEKKFKKLNIKTKYYNPQIHLASFSLPNYVKEYFKY
jgi:spermidine synthase